MSDDKDYEEQLREWKCSAIYWLVQNLEAFMIESGLKDCLIGTTPPPPPDPEDEDGD